MTEKEVLRYLALVERRLFILTTGIHWKPEYASELKAIDQELAKLRVLVDQEHKQKEARKASAI